MMRVTKSYNYFETLDIEPVSQDNFSKSWSNLSVNCEMQK